MDAYCASSASQKMLSWLCLSHRNSEGWIYFITFKTHEQQWQYCTEFLLDTVLRWVCLRQQINDVLSALNVKYIAMQGRKLPYYLTKLVLLRAYLTIEYLLVFSSSFRDHYLCIWGKPELCQAGFLSELWEREDSAHHRTTS